MAQKVKEKKACGTNKNAKDSDEKVSQDDDQTHDSSKVKFPDLTNINRSDVINLEELCIIYYLQRRNQIQGQELAKREEVIQKVFAHKKLIIFVLSLILGSQIEFDSNNLETFRHHVLSIKARDLRVDVCQKKVFSKHTWLIY